MYTLGTLITMALDSSRDYRQRTEAVNVFKAHTDIPIIDRRVERSGANRLKREVISLKRESEFPLGAP